MSLLYGIGSLVKEGSFVPRSKDGAATMENLALIDLWSSTFITLGLHYIGGVSKAILGSVIWPVLAFWYMIAGAASDVKRKPELR